MRDDELDKLLQAGVESYGKAEPLSGIEDRALRRVKESREAKRRLWVSWAVATACACLLLAVVVGNRGGWSVQHARVANPEVASGRVAAAYPEMVEKVTDLTEAEAPRLQVGSAKSGSRLARKQVEPKREKLPKLEVFPTPQPLSAEERALADFAKQHPKLATELIEEAKRSAEPIQTAEIHIEPLMIDGPQQEGETNAKDR